MKRLKALVVYILQAKLFKCASSLTTTDMSLSLG